MKCKTLKNKIYAMLLMTVGILSTTIDSDATFFVLTFSIGLPMFFAKENWIC